MKIFLIAAALAVPAAPALAQRSVKISYRAGALATAEGRQALHRRVNRAVVHVCGDDRATGSMLSNPAVRACHRQAAAAARPQVDRAIALANRGVEIASRDR
ncbi:UrcA family protein [Nostoc ellipsosporum NOK]|uniref:UrcA family protein n=1 Tax=Sphingomonas sp. IBVSS2 TaxID=1985172 RepID=UPI0015C50FAF|nr:UrcA family protein [Sphingomonas sp. IBVSS2]MDF2384608.1 UrcA family protein [Nostoc ellipsosporum NOK]